MPVFKKPACPEYFMGGNFFYFYFFYKKALLKPFSPHILPFGV